MAVALEDYVASLKREVQPPGSNLFASATDADWVGYLADAFWEARLDGLLEGYVVEYEPGASEGEIAATSGVEDDDLDGRGMALLVLYAGIRVLRNRIVNMSQGFKAKAGPVEYEQNMAATVLAEMLKQLRATKDRILEALDDDAETAVLMIDTYSSRVFLDGAGYYPTSELSG